MKGMCHSSGARGREEIRKLQNKEGRMELHGGKSLSPTWNFWEPGKAVGLSPKRAPGLESGRDSCQQPLRGSSLNEHKW